MMKWILLSALSWSSFVFPQILDGDRADFLNPEQRLNAITDPSISRRCLRLLETRQEKLKTKQKLMGLIERNQYLQKQTPKK
jgi:hypothetical protein